MLRPEFLQRLDKLLQQEIAHAQSANEKVIRDLSEQVVLLQTEVARWKAMYEKERKRKREENEQNTREYQSENIKHHQSEKNTDDRQFESKQIISKHHQSGLQNISKHRQSGLQNIPNQTNPSLETAHKRLCARKDSDQSLSPVLKSSPNRFKALRMESMDISRAMREIPDLRSKSMVDVSPDDFHILPTQYSDDDSPDAYHRSPLKGKDKRNENEEMNGEDIRDIVRENGDIDIKDNGDINTDDHIWTDGPLLQPSQSTAYSSSPIKVSREPATKIRESPSKAMVGSSQVEDSEDEVEFRIPDLPRPYTILQRRDYLQKYYHGHIGELKMNLSANPITEHRWIISDFKPNEQFRRDKQRVLTMGQDKQRKRFANAVGGGDNPDDSDAHFLDMVSQIYDKVPSPPGFMSSEFPNTQQQEERRRLIQERQARRVERRIKECLKVRAGRQVGEFVFAYDVVNEYVKKGRWYVRNEEKR